MEKETRTCVVCGNEFLTKNPRSIACSRNCYYRFHKPPVAQKFCIMCGKEILHKKAIIETPRKDAKYCSHTCAQVHWNRAHPEKMKEIRKVYNKTPQRKAYMAGYKIENKYKLSKWYADYYHENHEKIEKYQRSWSNNNKDKCKRYSAKFNSKATVELLASYVNSLISDSTYHGIEITPEMTEAKREIISLKRQRKL